MRRIFQDISAFILYFALVAIVFSGVIIGRGVFFAGDISHHYIPWETFVDEQIEKGHFPLWTPGFFGGHPIHAEGQSGILYPITRLVYLIFDGALAFSIDMLIHLALGGLFLYILARNLKLGYYPSLYAGTVFTVAGYCVSLIVNAPILRSVIWIPVIIKILWDIWNGFGVRAGIWLAFAIAIQIFAGSIQVVAMTITLILFISIIFFISQTARRKSTILPLVCIFVIGIPLAFILACIQILPTLELYLQSFIHLDLKKDVIYSFSPYHLLDMLIPPYWAQNANILKNEKIPFQMNLFLYLGIIPFIMVLIGFFMARSPLIWKFTALLGILIALGENTVFYSIFLKILPPLGNFRAPDRFLVFYALSASLLAGYGFSHYLRHELPTDPKIKRKWYVFWGIFAFILFLIALAIDLIIPGTVEKLYAEIHENLTKINQNGYSISNFALILKAAYLEIIFAGLLVLGIALFSSYFRKSELRTLILGILIFMLTIIESVLYLKIYPGTKLIKPSYYKEKPSSVQAIFDTEKLETDKENENNPSAKKYDEKLFRIAVIGHIDYSKSIFGEVPLLLWYHGGGRKDDFIKFREILSPNLGNIYGLNYIDGISSLYTSSWYHYMEMLEFQEDIYKTIPEYFGPRVHLWDLSGVKYIVSNVELKEGRLEKVYSGDVNVYRNKRALPKAFIIFPEKVLPEDKIVRESMMKGELDLTKYLVVDYASKNFSGFETYNDIPRYNPVKIDNYSPTRIEISGVSIADGYLILTDAYYPGWKCSINGSHVPIAKAYGYFRAVPVKSGRFNAVFTYEPASFKNGCIISIIGIIIWVILFCASLKTTLDVEVEKIEQSAP